MTYLKRHAATCFFVIFVITQGVVGLYFADQNADIRKGTAKLEKIQTESCEARKEAREILTSAIYTFIDLSRARGLEPQSEVAVNNLDLLIQTSYRPLVCE